MSCAARRLELIKMILSKNCFLLFKYQWTCRRFINKLILNCLKFLNFFILTLVLQQKLISNHCYPIFLEFDKQDVQFVVGTNHADLTKIDIRENAVDNFLMLYSKPKNIGKKRGLLKNVKIRIHA